MSNLENLIEDLLENLSTEDLVEVHNKYCELINAMDDEIYDNDKANLLALTGTNAYEAIQMAIYGEYSPTDKYVSLDGKGNLETFNLVDNHIFITDMIPTIKENTHEFTNWLPELDEVF